MKLAKTLPILELDSIVEINTALMEYGFFYLKNERISKKIIGSMEAGAKHFFEADIEFKNSISMTKSGRSWRGYFAVGQELTSGLPDQKEGLYFGAENSHLNLPLHGKNVWPSGKSYSEFKRSVELYMKEIGKLACLLLESIAIGLGLDRNYFSTRFTNEPTTLFRIFNYPKTTDEGWGVQEHTDMGFLTLLLQDSNRGLEVKDVNGTWISVPPVENTFVVNIGDMLEVWTRGLLRATPHRVCNQALDDRLSFPFFYDPNWDASLEPIDFGKLNGFDKVTPRIRWDKVDLNELAADLTYGEYVWNKVQKVFPKM